MGLVTILPTYFVPYTNKYMCTYKQTRAKSGPTQQTLLSLIKSLNKSSFFVVAYFTASPIPNGKKLVNQL